MKQLNEASANLMEHLLFVLNHSMELKSDGVDPMIPFALVVKGENKAMKAFAGDTPDYAEKMFENTIRNENPDFIVYASDSYLTQEGKKYNAVLIRAYDRNDTEIYTVGQKFQPKTTTEAFTAIGNPGFLGTTLNQFGAGGDNPQENKNKPWWKF